MTTNITLIGMPGAGKTVIGSLLSNALEYALVDTDGLIETRFASTLQKVLDDNGYSKLREFEAQEIQTLRCENSVIATGGSAIYSPDAMNYLASISTIVFLDISLATLIERVNNFSQRGIARAPEQTLEMLYAERLPLYRQHAELQVLSDKKTPEMVLDEILHLYREKQRQLGPAAGIEAI